jgi:uncharacterized membrane protein
VPSALVVLTFVAALGSGLTAGVLFGFSTFVMPALERLPAAQGIAAMQSINVKAINPPFMAALFGSGVLSLGLAVFALTQLGESWAPYLVAAAVIYLAGPVGLTAGYHQPRNLLLAERGPAMPEAAGYWSHYLREWTRWNHARVAAALVASALQTGALYVG